MSKAENTPESNNGAGDDRTEKQKKLAEKLQSIGMMPGGNDEKVAVEKQNTRFPKLSTMVVLVIVVGGAVLWMSQSEQAAEKARAMPAKNAAAHLPVPVQTLPVMPAQPDYSMPSQANQNSWQTNPYNSSYQGYNQGYAQPDHYNSYYGQPYSGQYYPDNVYPNSYAAHHLQAPPAPESQHNSYSQNQYGMPPNYYGYPQPYAQDYQWPQMPPQAYYAYPPNNPYWGQPAAPDYQSAQPYSPQQYYYK